jgi:hypothetical protein
MVHLDHRRGGPFLAEELVAGGCDTFPSASNGTCPAVNKIPSMPVTFIRW